MSACGVGVKRWAEELPRVDRVAGRVGGMYSVLCAALIGDCNMMKQLKHTVCACFNRELHKV